MLTLYNFSLFYLILKQQKPFEKNKILKKCLIWSKKMFFELLSKNDEKNFFVKKVTFDSDGPRFTF